MRVLKAGATIALLLDSAPRTWTSQEEIHLRLCRSLVRMNVKPVLVYSDGLSSEIKKPLESAGAIIEVAKYGGPSFGYFLALRRILKKHAVSMVHICFFDYFSPLPWFVRLSGISTLVFEQLNSGVLRATSWRRKLVQLRGAFATYPSLRVIAISHFVKEELIKSGVDRHRIIVRHLGVDTDRFKPDPLARHSLAQEFAIGPDEIIISTVSVMRAFKNPQTIVRACGLLAQRGIAFHLFVAGDGDMLSELQQLALESGIQRSVTWLGYCKDPKRLLQSSDIFVLASIGEAFGLVLAEAMACGVPVVGSRSGAIPEIVEDRHTGILAEPEDSTAFADALEKISREVQLRKQMGIRSRNRVQEYFEVELDVKNTIEIYESLGSPD